MEALEKCFGELAELFGHKYDDFFFDYLKSISVPDSSKCGKEIKKGEGGWECKDCELDTSSIYCNDCFIKEKHLDHNFYFNQGSCGFCDCGVDSVIKQEGFCNKHKGEYNNMSDLMNFIKSSINEKLLDNINNIFNKIIWLFIDQIKIMDEKKDENTYDIYKIFDSLEIFGDKLYKNNLSLLYLFTIKFTENFPYETNHKCFNYDENKNLVAFNGKDKGKKHICSCPFMQVMIYVLMKKENKQNSQSFFILFLQTYKNKIVSSVCFLNSFSELFHNNNLQNFREMDFQLVNENIGILVYKNQNIPFLESCFKDIYSKCNYFLKEKYYEKLSLISYRLKCLMKFLPNKNIINKMNSNNIILEIIIDICCLINNENELEIKISNDGSNNNKNEAYNSDLLETEASCLSTTIYLIHIINFDDKEVVNLIFNIIFKKLDMFRKYKES